VPRFNREVLIRSTQVYRALNEIPNRFALCMTISRSVRIIHKNGSSMENTVTSVFTGIQEGRFSSQLEAAPVVPAWDGTTALFHYGDLF
jgi:hypothetical protein